MPRGDHAFRAVTERSPCPTCMSNGWCRVSADGSVVLCRRVQEGGRAKLDAVGVPYYIHRIGPSSGPIPVAEVIDRVVEHLLARASVEVLGEVYAALLEWLTLSPEHRAELRRRGLPDAEIERRGYRTLPPEGPPWRREKLARHLADVFSLEVLLSVPGIVRTTSKTTGKPYVTIAGGAGLLIPVRDLAGREIALLVRPDTPRDNAGKYVWLSSTWAGGPGPGTPAHVPLPMPGAPEARDGTVAVYEGILKSDVAAALDPARLPAVGIAGAMGWRLAILILNKMSPRVVRYYPDPDAWDSGKPAVGGSLRAFRSALQEEGFIFELGRFHDDAEAG